MLRRHALLTTLTPLSSSSSLSSLSTPCSPSFRSWRYPHHALRTSARWSSSSSPSTASPPPQNHNNASSVPADATDSKNNSSNPPRTQCVVLSRGTIYQGNTPMVWQGASSDGANTTEASTSSHIGNNAHVLVAQSRPFAVRLSAFGMPRGFPLSCAPGYARFFYAYVLHAFISNFSMSIATQALLGGFFAESTPQVWMLKDLAPSLLAAYLANRVASYEMRPKYWMIVSVLLSQGASIVDLFIPLCVPPKYLLAAAIATAVIKNNAVLMHFVARASVLQHFAIYQNLGEVQKKLNSFGMINYPIATALGIAYTSLFPSFAVHAATIGVCSMLSVWLMHYSLAHVAFRGLTPITGQIVTEAFVHSRYKAVPTLEAVQTQLGVTAVLSNNHYAEKQLAVNPALTRVVVTEEGTLIAGKGIHFTIGVWEVKDVKATFAERCGVGKWFGGRDTRKKRGSDKKNTNVVRSRTRLVLLVHRKCPPSQLFLAHLLIYSAMHSKDALEAFKLKGRGSVAGCASLLSASSASPSSSSLEWVSDWVDAIRSFFSAEMLEGLVGLSTPSSSSSSSTSSSSCLTTALEEAALELETALARHRKGRGAGGSGEASSLASSDFDVASWIRSDVADPYRMKVEEGRGEGNLPTLLWLRRTAVFAETLKEKGWDVLTPSLDPIEGRISTVPEADDG